MCIRDRCDGHLSDRQHRGDPGPAMTVPAVRACAVAIASLLVFAAAARAQDTEPEPINDSEGYTPPPETATPLSINGYVDVGFAKAQGDGTSFAPADTRVPLDYGVDGFAPAVNSRGDAASTDPGPGRVVNGFLPPSAGIGRRPSLLLNTLNVDLRYAAARAPLTVFPRVQFVPRFS